MTAFEPRDKAPFYVTRSGRTVYVKDGPFFRSQGGLNEAWGLNWVPMYGTSIEDARRNGAEHFATAMEDEPVSNDRYRRQVAVAAWARHAFGKEHADNPKQRAVRLAEETIELCQVAKADPAMLHKLIDYVYSRPVGTYEQELGGVGVTLLAFAHAAGCSADKCESDEVERILSLPLEQFAARNDEKNDAGFNTQAVVTKPKYCVDCRYSKRLTYHYEWHCFRPNIGATNLVTGQPFPENCLRERESNRPTACGPDAQFFAVDNGRLKS